MKKTRVYLIPREASMPSDMLDSAWLKSVSVFQGMALVEPFKPELLYLFTAKGSFRI